MNFNVPFSSSSQSRNLSTGFSKGPIKSIMSGNGGKFGNDNKKSSIVTTPGKSGYTFSISPMKNGGGLTLSSRLKQETFSSAMKKH